MRLLGFFALIVLASSCKKDKAAIKVPVCRFTKMGSNGGLKYPVTYPQDTVALIGEDYSGYTLYYNKQGRLWRKDYPILRPYRRSVLIYNDLGQVSELNYYLLQGGNWTYEGKRIFTYNGGKLVNISNPGVSSNYQINWAGNDIKSVSYREGPQITCTMNFTYDGSIKNPNLQFSNFYFVDDNTNDVNYKLPYYFSEHLLTKQDTDCWTEEPKLFLYTFAPNGFIAAVEIQQDISSFLVWQYEYECN